MVSCTAIWSNPVFTIPHFLSGRNPGFRRNQVVIQSHPSFHFILGPTNIRSTPGFIVIGRVNCYLVEIQASQCLVSLSGRNLGFTMFYTIIWSNPVFMVSCTVIWSIPGFSPLPLSGRNPGFTTFYFLSGRIPGFIRNQVVIWSHPGFHFKAY